MTPIESPAAMSIKQAAKYLAISEASLFRLLKVGELRPAKVGGRTLIRRLDADELLARSIERPITAVKIERSSDDVFA